MCFTKKQNQKIMCVTNCVPDSASSAVVPHKQEVIQKWAITREHMTAGGAL